MSAAKTFVIALVVLAATGADAFATGTVTFRGIGDTGSCPVKPWTPTQTARRGKQVSVSFASPYSAPPMVVLSISGMDTNKNFNVRIYTEAAEVSTDGFVLKAGVWCNTYLYKLDVTWLAVPNVYETTPAHAFV